METTSCIKYKFSFSYKYCLTCKIKHRICRNCNDIINTLSNNIIIQCCNHCLYIPYDIKITQELEWNKINSQYFFENRINYPSWKTNVIKTIFMIIIRLNTVDSHYLPLELWIIILKYLKVKDIGREINNHSCNRNESKTLTWCKKCKRWHKYEEGNILTIMENYKDNIEFIRQLLYLIFFTSKINPFNNVDGYSNTKIKKYFINNYYVRSVGLFTNYKNHIIKTLNTDIIR